MRNYFCDAMRLADGVYLWEAHHAGGRSRLNRNFRGNFRKIRTCDLRFGGVK